MSWRSYVSAVPGALGGMRLALLAAVLLMLVLMPEPGTRAVYHGWPLVSTVVIPVLAPMCFLVLLLDALMARVFLSDAEGERRRQLRRVIGIDLAAAGLLVVRWLPYYLALRV